jgi:two-component system KDP operon response regulator KdpE
MAVVPGSPSSSPPAEQAPATLLLVEDDAALATVLASALEARGHRVHVEPTGRGALQAVSVHSPDVVILDLGLPDLDGLEVCRSLRRWFPYPIIVLSADADEGRKVAALDLGADDYVTKPFSTPELFARLRVALRHGRTLAAVADPDVVRVGDLVVDVAAHEASVAGVPMTLTRKEFALLSVLSRNSGRVLTHGALFTHVWGSDGPARADSLRVHVTQLRKKLGDGPDRPTLLTEPGVGYRLVAPG